MQVLRRFSSVFTAVAISALFALAATAADKPEASWENVQQLKAGQKIHIVRADLKSVTGHFVSVAADSVALKTAAGEQTLNRVDINRITRSGGQRGRNALIGAAVGGGAGAAVGATAQGRGGAMTPQGLLAETRPVYLLENDASLQGLCSLIRVDPGPAWMGTG